MSIQTDPTVHSSLDGLISIQTDPTVHSSLHFYPNWPPLDILYLSYPNWPPLEILYLSYPNWPPLEILYLSYPNWPPLAISLYFSTYQIQTCPTLHLACSTLYIPHQHFILLNFLIKLYPVVCTRGSSTKDIRFFGHFLTYPPTHIRFSPILKIFLDR